MVLSDFGISKRVEECSSQTATIGGTEAFMAPELRGYLDDIKPKTVADLQAADIWALGEIVFQMLTGEHTFRTPPELVKYCNNQKSFPFKRLPEETTKDGQEFIVGMMAPLPQHRMTTIQCMEHSWMIPVLVQEEPVQPDLGEKSLLLPKLPQLWSTSAGWSSLSDTERMDPHTILLSEPVTLPQVRSELELVQTRTVDSTEECLPCFSADGELLALIRLIRGKTLAYKVHILDTQSGEERGSIYTEYPAYEAAFSQDKQQLAILADWKVIFWDISSSKLLMETGSLHEYILHLKYTIRMPWCIAFTPDNRLAIGTSDGTIELWNPRSGICVETLMDETRMGIEAVTFSPDGTLLTSRSSAGRTAVRDVRSGKVICSHFDGMTFGPSNKTGAISLSLDSRRLAHVAPNNTVQVWDVKSRKLLQTLGYSEDVQALSFMLDGRLVSATINGTVRFWAEKESNRF